MKNVNESLRKERDHDVVPFERGEMTQPQLENSDALISRRQTEELRERWTGVQSSFVDEPRKAVEEADKLVNSAIKQIEETFRAQRGELETQWNKGEEASTEDLRICLQRYRAFFDRLLAM